MISRFLARRILAALQDTPVVYLQGARQTGKSTLVQAIAAQRPGTQYLSCDTAAVMAAATSDPEGFIAGLEGPAIIDEVQRVPALAVAIKSAVDRDRTPGRFLLTGSAGVLTLPNLSESLAGRIELHTLWPFSQGEKAGREETFIDRLFSRRPAATEFTNTSEKNLLERIGKGGYPEVQGRAKADRRRAWFDSYVTTIIERDIRDLANIERLSDVPRLLALVASRAGELLNYADLSRMLTTPQSTLKRYMALLETTFLIRTIPAWFTNVGKRLTKSPKLLVVDTGLLCYLLDADARRLRTNRTLLGHVLENFVAMELLKQLGWSSNQCRLFHFRTEIGHEVDLVLEDSAGRVVGIEVKCAATLKKTDFRGLEALAESAGEKFFRGIVLYTGEDVVPFSANLRAMPIGQLWA